MPSSVSGRLISGSWTVARAALTASSAGEPVSVSDIVACVSFDGDPAPRPRSGGDLRLADLRPLYGGRHPRPPAGRAICCASGASSEALRPVRTLPKRREGGKDCPVDRCPGPPLRANVFRMTTTMIRSHDTTRTTSGVDSLRVLMNDALSVASDDDAGS